MLSPAWAPGRGWASLGGQVRAPALKRAQCPALLPCTGRFTFRGRASGLRRARVAGVVRPLGVSVRASGTGEHLHAGPQRKAAAPAWARADFSSPPRPPGAEGGGGPACPPFALGHRCWAAGLGLGLNNDSTSFASSGWQAAPVRLLL